MNSGIQVSHHPEAGSANQADFAHNVPFGRHDLAQVVGRPCGFERQEETSGDAADGDSDCGA